MNSQGDGRDVEDARSHRARADQSRTDLGPSWPLPRSTILLLRHRRRVLCLASPLPPSTLELMRGTRLTCKSCWALRTWHCRRRGGGRGSVVETASVLGREQRARGLRERAEPSANWPSVRLWVHGAHALGAAGSRGRSFCVREPPCLPPLPFPTSLPRTLRPSLLHSSSKCCSVAGKPLWSLLRRRPR